MKYSWRCKVCSAEVVVDRQLADYECPPEGEEASCGHEDWARIIGPTTFLLQGGGWYRNGY